MIEYYAEIAQYKRFSLPYFIAQSEQLCVVGLY